MFCPSCGTENQENAQFCSKCGGQMATAPTQTAPPAASVPLLPGEVPTEIKGFNFGAFALNFIWAFAHNLIGWGIIILVIGLIPVVQIINIGFAIYLGVKGNELAWKKRRFESVQQFKETQRVWNIAGIIVFCTFIPVSIAITGILAAVAIPNFLRASNQANANHLQARRQAIPHRGEENVLEASDQAKYTNCLQTLTGLKVAEEMHVTDNGVYTDQSDRLAIYIIPGCTDPTGAAAGCGDALTTRMKKNCDNVMLHSLAGGYDYEITGVAKDRFRANICVNPKGYKPDSYKDVNSTTVMSCP